MLAQAHTFMKHLFSLNIIILVSFKELQGDGLVYGAPLYVMINVSSWWCIEKRLKGMFVEYLYE